MRISDWSSDVCSSDLHGIRGLGSGRRGKVKKAAIIGAGIGGLALAIRLQSAGIATTVIEGRDRPGGRAYVWEKDGFTFDAGPTVITDPGALGELWQMTGHEMAENGALGPVRDWESVVEGKGVSVRVDTGGGRI